MKSIVGLLFLLPVLTFSQNPVPPDISAASGFYDAAFQVSLSHPDPNVRILYTLDGSEPSLDNLNGKEWNYKTTYPIFPGDDFGEKLQDTLWTYEYTDSIFIENRTFEESTLADIYTTVLRHGIYSNETLFKGTILRASAYSEATQEYSEVVSRSYFVEPNIQNRYTVPVISISLDNDKFYGYEDGIGVPGILFDNWRTDNPDAPINGFAPANYQLRGSSSEVEIHFNYFENGEEILNHNAGLRINGGYTRSYPNKSLRLYAKSKYGESNFRHNFFEGYDTNKFKRLILRNSGNDAGASFFRDVLAHKLTENLNFDIQESQPIVVFINGEYNGLRNIRERYDKKYFESVHDIPEDSLDFLENYLEVKEGDRVMYDEMMDFFTQNSFNDDIVYEEGVTYLDPINFTDYYATNIYVANDDWPGNNFLFFRHKTTYDANNGEIGVKDGRFRWILKDLDRGFYLNMRFENGYEGNTLAWATEENQATLIIRRLLENEKFKQYFINRFADLLNTTFKEDRVLSIIENFEDLYSPEIEENGRRWHGFTLMPSAWQNDVNRMKNFAVNRPTHQREHIIEKFDLDGVFDLVLNLSNEDHGFIQLNSININSTTDGIGTSAYPWLGEYFLNVPISLKAIPKEGYEFSHWSGASNSTDEEISLTLNNDSYIKAHFIPETMGVSDLDKPEIILYPNPTSDKLYISSQVTWKSYIIYDTQGRKMKSGLIENNTIAMPELSSAMYFIQLESVDGAIKQRRIVKK